MRISLVHVLFILIIILIIQFIIGIIVLIVQIFPIALFVFDSIVNLFTMNGNLFGGVYTDTNLGSTYPQDGQTHVITNVNGFAYTASKN